MFEIGDAAYRECIRRPNLLVLFSVDRRYCSATRQQPQASEDCEIIFRNLIHVYRMDSTGRNQLFEIIEKCPAGENRPVTDYKNGIVGFVVLCGRKKNKYADASCLFAFWWSVYWYKWTNLAHKSHSMPPSIDSGRICYVFCVLRTKKLVCAIQSASSRSLQNIHLFVVLIRSR